MNAARLSLSRYFAVWFSVSASAAYAADPPAPIGACPSAAQLAWHEQPFYGFVHFTMNTFTDREWGQGDESESLFNPSELDCRQWARVARDAGMSGLIITAKHHDGFCLWPSRYTEHSVKASPWKDGKGDVLRELRKACDEFGLRFGVYLSPWDCNHAEYGRPAYVEHYRNQVRELFDNYGPICEFWLDGANGGRGYYGGAREARTIDRATYYGWDVTNRLILEKSPRTIIFSDMGPGCRWVGNESGFAVEPHWATYTPRGATRPEAPAPGDTVYKEGETGHKGGKFWMPAEVDVSIRPGWFYHAAEDAKVKTPQQLIEIYYKSVGLGANLLLNVPPDRRGLIPENDA
ncbi:MAG: alpha-L-fucosidase, partial [Planctomycetes bacterium]|nr:alpha-L-fucosidase [Planctomycetota bacterium]